MNARIEARLSGRIGAGNEKADTVLAFYLIVSRNLPLTAAGYEECERMLRNYGIRAPCETCAPNYVRSIVGLAYGNVFAARDFINDNAGSSPAS